MGKLVFRVASDWQEVVRLRTEIEKLKQTLLSMDLNQSPDTFKKLNIQLGDSSKKLDELVTEAAKAGAVMEGDFKKKIFDASQTVNGFTEKIISQKAVVKDVEADVRRLGDAYRITLKRNPLSASGKLEEYKSAKRALDEEKAALFGLTQQQANARLAVKKLRDEYSLYNNDGKQVIETNKGIGLSLGKALGVIGGIATLKQLGSEIIRVRGEFQSMQTAIETMVGKDVAGKLMPQIKELAKISPLTMSDMVGAEKMMLGFNIQAEDTIKYLKALSDISMGESSKFNSLTLAFSQMSAAGKLMGQDLNQMINAGFNPLQVIAEKTGKSIATLKEEMSKGAISAEMVQQAFIDATSAGGKFYGMSENASQTINGQISMMQDAWDNALNEIGKSSEGFIMSGVQATTSLIQNYETIGKVLVGLIATYGTYRTAVITNIALTRGWAVAARADALAKGLQTIATKAQTIAQLALNSAMKANPYVLAATLITGVVSAMWAFSDSTSEVERRQERLSKVSKDLNTEIGKETKIAKDLFDKLKKAKEGTTEYSDAKQVILDKYGQYLSGMNSEISTLKDQEKAYNAVTDAIKRNVSEKLKEKFINEGVGDSSAKQSEALKMIRESLIKKYTSFADALKGEYNPTKESEEAFNAVKELLAKDDISGASNLLFKDYGLNFMGDAGKGLEQYKNAANEIKQVFKDADDLFSFKKDNSDSVVQSNVSKEIVDVTNKIAKLRKEISDIRSGKVQVEYGKTVESVIESKKKDLQDAEKSLETLTGISSSKQESETEKQRKKQQKLAEELLSIRRQNQQDEIYLMKEGSDKKLKQIELDYQKEIDAVKKQEKAWSSEQGGKLTQEQSVEISTRYTNADSKRDKSIADVYSEQMEKYKGLLSKYQDYTDQRLEIEKKFNDDIAVLQEARKKAEKQDNVDEVARVDRSIAKAIAEKGKELMRHDFDVLKQSPEYIRAFEDLRNTSSETLNSLLSQLENAKQTAAQTLNPKDLREYTTTIQEIMDELDTRNPFTALVDRQTELAEAERELADAKKQLDAVNGGSKIVTGVKSTSLGKDGKIRVENTYLTAGKALEKYNAAKDKAQKANNTFIKAEESAKERIDELGNAIRGIGDSIGSTSGEIISLIGDVALFTTGTIDGITKVAQTGANAMSAVEKASVILGIISAGIQLLQQLNSILPTADNQYEKFAEKVAEINKLTDAVNEYRIAALEAQQAENNWFSDDNLKNLRDYKKLHDEVAEAYKNKAKESQAIYQNKSGGGWFTNSWNWILDNTYGKLYGVDFARKYEEGQIAAINNLRIETRSRKKGFLGSGIGGRSQKTEDLVSWARNNGLGELFDNEGLINKEAANAILNQYGDKLVGQTKETLESLIELREKYDEYIEQLHEYVSSLYEPLVNNFVDSIWNWLDSGKDALNSFRDYASDTFRDIASDMLKSIVISKIFGEGENSYQNKVNRVYDDYAKGLIDEVELNRQVTQLTGDLMKNAENQLPAIQGMAENISNTIKNTTGIDITGSSTSQSSSQKGFTAMSQDTGEELNGRFTALQIAGEEVKNQNILQTQSLNILTVKADAILSVNTDTRNIADEIRTIQVNSYLELQEIRENTSAIVKPIQQMQKDIAEVKKNTSKL